MDDLERQLHSYWSDITDGYPLPKVGPMPGVVQLEPDTPISDDYWGETITLEAPPEKPTRQRWYVGVAAAAILLVAFSGMYVLSRTVGLNPGAEVETPNVVPENFYELPSPEGTSGLRGFSDDPVGPQPKPNIINAISGDDGERPLPLGTITELPAGVYPDLLAEICQTEGCGRDDHGFVDLNFIDPDDPTREVGAVKARDPIFIRQGFVNETEEPLGDGFDVALYVIGPDTTGPFGGENTGATTRYTSDYVVRGETDRCGPNYETQDGSVTCEWFVFEFPNGVTEGSFTLWAVWEAPCSAWIDLGYTNFCADADEVMSFFSTAYGGRFESSVPTVPQSDGLIFSLEDRHDDRVTIDASGSRPSDGTPLPDIERAIPGDDGSDTLPIGAISAKLPVSDYLDFLFEHCDPDVQTLDQGLGVVRSCSRSAAFVQPANPNFGAGTIYTYSYANGRPFYVRQGFVNNTGESLGEGFDVVVYVFEIDDEDWEFGGATRRYGSDYVFRGETDRCGPGYNGQIGPVTCEWFVHEFPDGLPEGRFAMWAVWEAPCRAWIDLGFTESCDDPNEVTSFFSSGTAYGFDSSFVDYNRPRPIPRSNR